MKKNKFKPELLNEELKKFKLLSEYHFYPNENVTYGYNNKPVILGDVSLGDVSEAEEENADAENEADAIAADLGLDQPEEAPKDDAEKTDDLSTDTPEDEEKVDDTTPEAEPATASDEIEVDVTSLVKGSEDAKAAADKATANTEILLQKLADLESRVATMDNITNKIEGLEKELIKRNPTPVEKLEMRSLSSFPYSQKLTDYWADKQGAYDVMGTGKEGEENKEYVLTQKDVDYDYSEPQIKQSFGVSPDDYEEEEI